ncbi:MAG: protein-L-isoaspartate(D-aspartate) O-methyltransferase [Desulfobacca sp.]|uniref:protein-L-isoaspartate(D-aspartate) O-methyltransferase n=1 Tax=Desulfobacca sp. TaxID=2067990 RepID=UPI004049AC57
MAAQKTADAMAAARENMVRSQLIPRGIRAPKVLAAMRKVPRHLFVEEALRSQAYGDFPLPIGEQQTISQPYMVALMTEALELEGNEKVLEIGTGCGYQAAILAEIVPEVYSIERLPDLAAKARRTLEALRYFNVRIKVGDGTLGWPEAAPFQAIIVTAAAPGIPRPLLDQLATGGRLVIPVGDRFSQTLDVVHKTPEGIRHDYRGGCRFVKLIGSYGWEA